MWIWLATRLVKGWRFYRRLSNRQVENQRLWQPNIERSAQQLSFNYRGPSGYVWGVSRRLPRFGPLLHVRGLPDRANSGRAICYLLLVRRFTKAPFR